MRCRYVLLGVCVLLPSGCGGLMSMCGKDITELSTREVVRAQFGQPKASGKDEGGDAWEEFHTRTLISNPYGGPGYGMAFGMSFGLSELYFVPRELIRLTSAVVFGQDLMFTYEETGRVKYAEVDGDPHYMIGRRIRFRKQPASEPQSAPEPPASSPAP